MVATCDRGPACRSFVAEVAHVNLALNLIGGCSNDASQRVVLVRALAVQAKWRLGEFQVVGNLLFGEAPLALDQMADEQALLSCPAESRDAYVEAVSQGGL